MNVAAGGAANMVKMAVQLVLLPVMAHLLGPAEFGVYALALPMVSFFMALADGGLGTSLAREREQSTVVWSTAFWVLLFGGVLLAGVVSIWGVALSILSHEPRLEGIMAFLSISFVLITTSVLPMARLTRQGRLVIFSAADMGSTLVGAVVAVVLALHGAGAWSLAAQYVSGFLVRSVVLNAVAFAMPTFAFDLSSLRQHLSTGSAVLGSRLADFAGRLVENLLFGRAFGAAALGSYTFANQAPRFICEAASGPVWAALYAHALTADKPSTLRLHRRLIHLLAVAVFPVAGLLAAAAPEVLALLLGPKWTSAATLLRILVPAYALNVIAAQTCPIMIVDGRNWALFLAQCGLTLGRVVAVAAGFWGGPIVVVTGVALVQVVYTAYMLGTVGSPAGPLFRGLLAPALASLGAGLVCFGLLSSDPSGLAWAASSLLIGAAVYVLILAALDGPHLLGELQVVLRIVLRRREG